MANLQFNATQVAPDVAFDPLPAGWYPAVMEKSEIKPTKDNATSGGFYLACTFNILGPDPQKHKGRKAFVNLNLKNANAQTQEIAYRQLSAICHATGQLNIQDSQELHNIPLAIKLKVTPAQDGYEARNDISGYKNIREYDGGGTGQQAPVSNGFGQQTQNFQTQSNVGDATHNPVFQSGGNQQFQPEQTNTQWQQPAAEQPWAQGNQQQAQPVQQQTNWAQGQPVQQNNGAQQTQQNQQLDQFASLQQQAQQARPPWAQ